MKSLNLGILAHVDAGKTSLTERLLFNAGVIETLGSVDEGNTQTDSLALERRRGITIKSAVTSFAIDDLKINLIDTPGHPDFIAEVERSLGVLDAVILVVSAVEGVQPQTRVLMRVLTKLRIPTIIFVNKIDRMGARSTELIEDIRKKLFSNVIAMNSVTAIGTRDVKIAVRKDSQLYDEELRTLLADRSEAFLGALIEDPEQLTVAVCHEELVTQIGYHEVCPVFFGSAIENIGVNEIAQAIKTYFTPSHVDEHDVLSSVVFKIERGLRDEKISYVRIYTGALHLREQVQCIGSANAQFTAKPTAMRLFENGTTVKVSVASAGDIVKVWGLSDCSIGDYIGKKMSRDNVMAHFTRPSLEVVIAPRVASSGPKLFSALQKINEQDPFIEVHQNVRDGVLSIRLCGEVQKEVIEDTLVSDYGLGVEFYDTTVICVERPISKGSGLEVGKKGDPYLGTVGLTIESGSINSGVEYRVADDALGTMPLAFFVAIEETVRETLKEGIYGWQVTDCIVTLTHTGFWPRQSHAHATFDKSMSSTAGDFRNMTPLALMNALKGAGTDVYEPMNRFELDVPREVLPRVMQSLIGVEAQMKSAPRMNQEGIHLEGLLPIRRAFEFERSIPGLTGGEGMFITEFGRYQKVKTPVPIRERTDNNPLDRQEYLRRTFTIF